MVIGRLSYTAKHLSALSFLGLFFQNLYRVNEQANRKAYLYSCTICLGVLDVANFTYLSVLVT